MRVQYQGKTLDDRTEKMIREANRLLGHPLTLSQGCYSNSVSASAGTHNGGGVVDVHVKGLGRPQILEIVRTLRTIGFAAWYRPAIAGLWPEHVHAVAVGCKDLAPAAERQVEELRDGGDGLRGAAGDPHAGMKLPVVSWEQYQKASLPAPKPKPEKPKPPVVVKNTQKNSDKHYAGRRLLKLEDRGTDVAFVQEFIDSRLVADGFFGPKTEKAVKAYQKMQGIPQTGEVGARTWSVILGRKVTL